MRVMSLERFRTGGGRLKVHKQFLSKCVGVLFNLVNSKKKGVNHMKHTMKHTPCRLTLNYRKIYNIQTGGRKQQSMEKWADD